MKFKVRIIAVFVLSVMCLNAHGQRLHADLAFDGLFDNREFKNDMLPQTIYGMRVMPQIGIDYGKHSLVAGVSKIWEFGSDQTIKPDVIMYYQYGGEKWSTLFGAIPRRSLQRQLPDAFLYDSIAFFEPTIAGTVIQYRGSILQSELYCNWFSRQSYTQREAFRIVWDGYIGNGLIGGGWYTAMTHFANTMQHNLFLFEKFQFNPYISLDLTSALPADFTLKADAGLLCSLVHCRRDDNWYSPTGFLGDIQVGWRMLDVKSTVYAGGSQQPLIDDPQAGLAFHRNDPFYNHSFYNRTELGIKFIADENVELGFRWNLHFTPGSPIHNQQLITLRYRIGMIKSLVNNP
jgi:hypothetical protein